MSLPAVIAHRGVSREAPENTLAAFERALVLRADGIELDVHKTADGAVVVHHDDIPRPADGQDSLASRPFPAMTLAEVKAVRLAGGHTIPTLQEVLDLVGSRLTVYCELKGTGVVSAAAPILAAHPGPAAMHSFDHRVVLEASRLAPRVPRGVLIANRMVETGPVLAAAKAIHLWPQREFVDRPLVNELHELKLQVIVWTANDPLEIKRLLALGVDGICTDDVALARSLRDSTIGAPTA